MACPPTASAQAAQGRMAVTIAFAVPTGERLEKTYEWRQVAETCGAAGFLEAARDFDFSDGVGTET